MLSIKQISIPNWVKMTLREGDDISFNPAYVQQKLTALNGKLKSYMIDEELKDKL